MRPEVKKEMVTGLIKSASMYVVLGVILFLGSGRLDWWMAWAFLGILVANTVLSYLVLDPELIAERSKAKAGMKRWDSVLVGVIVGGWLLLVLIAALDKRFGWSQPVPFGWQMVGLVLFILGSALQFWAMTANKFFSGVVRIQTDRRQTVASSGPYRFMRHPGYVAGIVIYFGIPLMLGTLWALIVSFLVLIDFVVRTALEDRVLHNELAGYADYAKKVRYRLIPGIW